MCSYDFLTERTENGRQLRILVVIDEFTRECLAIEGARSFTARDVIMTRQYLFAVRGAPEHLRSDNGPEFVAKEIQEWLGRACVRTLFIQKAGPWEKGTSRASMAGSETSCSTGTATTRLLSGKTILATWAASPDPVKLVVRRPGMPTV